jgi:hypothetical protein
MTTNTTTNGDRAMTDPTPPTPKHPTLLVDTDALIDLDAWEEEVREKRWLHYYLQITAAAPRNPQLLDALELAQSDGLRIAYSSRWPELTSYLVKPWLEERGYPDGFINWRRSGWASPAELAAMHAAAAGRRGPVLLVHNDSAVAAELRSRFGIAALTPAQLPGTVDGLRRVLALARPAPRLLKPRPKTENTNTTKASAA